MLSMLSRTDVAVTVGVLCAIGLVLIARARHRSREMLAYGIGLGVTAVAYVVFGVVLDAPASHLVLEVVGAGIFGTAAILGTRRWPLLLAAGWTAHAAWDLCLHQAQGPMFAPTWYPWFCVGFDVFVGGYIAGLVAAGRTSADRPVT